MAAINLNASTPTMVDLTSSAAAEFDPDQLFTCLSCSVAFLSPDEQREHMRSDWHRYNMKRRVATLPPVTAALFNRKVIERRNENAVTATKQGETCTLCAKSFASQGAYRTHVESKKHRDAELREATRLLRGALLGGEQPVEESPASGEVASFDPTSSAANSSTAPRDKPTPAPFVQPTTTNLIPSYDSYASVHTPNKPLPASEDPANNVASSSAAAPSLAIPEDADEETIQSTIDARIAFARTRLTPTSCLFCSHQPFPTSEDAIAHMQLAHGFFIPDREYLVDLPGFILYLSEKVAIGNVCLYCNGKGKEYKSMEAVRKHMVDKSHCKIAYSSEPERMEFSDYYDFSSSYSNPKPRRTRHRKHPKKDKLAAVDEEWEDDDGEAGSDADEEVEIVDESAQASSSKMDQDDEEEYDDSDDGTSSDGSGTSYTETDDSLSDSDAPGVTFDPESMELILPSGRRIGHRSLQRYYDQRPSTHTHAGALELVPSHRRSIKDKTDQALVSAKGGFGDKGRGGEVVRARNKGEAKNAAKNPYKAMQTRENFKMRVGSTSGNNMKHFRDRLLQ